LIVGENKIEKDIAIEVSRVCCSVLREYGGSKTLFQVDNQPFLNFQKKSYIRLTHQPVWFIFEMSE
jgi:hypothetical protein